MKRGSHFDGDFFGESPSFSSSFDRRNRPAIGHHRRSGAQESNLPPPVRRKNPEIRSSIDFTDKKIASDVDLFREGVSGGGGDEEWRNSSASGGNNNGTTIQKEETSAAFNFEGSSLTICR